MNARTPDLDRAPGRDADPPGGLVVGGAHGGLAVARSLGRRGIPVCFVTDDHPLAGFSRYVRAGAFAGRGRTIRARSKRCCGSPGNTAGPGWVLFPGGDAEVRFVAQNVAALSTVFRVMTPSWETVQWACDKRLTYQRAAALGIDIPRNGGAQSRRAGRAVPSGGSGRFRSLMRPCRSRKRSPGSRPRCAAASPHRVPRQPAGRTARHRQA